MLRELLAKLPLLWTRKTSQWKEGTRIRFDDRKLYIEGRTPEGKPFQEEVEWPEVVRVCMRLGVYTAPDEIYVLSREQERSYSIPTAADGGSALVGELMRRKLLDSAAIINAKDGEIVYGPSTDAFLSERG